MDDTHKKLQQLLDGDLDMKELENDPALASLASRLYGIKIASVTPTKPRSIDEEHPKFPQPTTPSDLFVETVEASFPQTPQPTPSTEIPSPVQSSPAKKKKSIRYVFLLGFLASLSNLFGAFGFLNSSCIGEKCTSDATRINLLDIQNLDNEMGWSQSILDGSYGLPDVAAITFNLVLFMWFNAKK